jgi:hypothetical protein
MTTFELSPAASEARAMYRPVRAMFSIILLVMIGIFAWFSVLLGGGIQNGFQLFAGVSVLLSTGLMAAYLTYALYKTGASAASMELDAEGVSFRYPSGDSTHVSWKEFSSKFILADYSISQGHSQRTVYPWEARRRFRPAIRLTSQAFEAVIAASQTHGIQFALQDRPIAWFGLSGCRIFTPVPSTTRP